MSLGRLFCHALLLCLMLGGPMAHAQTVTDTADYAVALIPVIPPSEIKRRWQPVLDQMARDTGLHFHFRFYEDFESFEAGLLRDEVDFALLSPVQVWRLRSHYRPQLRSTLPLTGIVVAHRNSVLKQLGDLNGRTLSLQQGENLSANFFVQQALRDQKISATFKTVRSESNALRSVVLGKSDAAIVNNYLLKLLPAEIVAQIRIIYRTQELAPPAIVANIRLPAGDVEKVKSALLRLRENRSPLLDVILMPDLMEADFERDYTSVGRALSAEVSNGSH